ncbi:MAG: ABC-F family ATP-binding cassette domain-containing protein [Rhodospirillales bacterium]|nr:ABC-F family ATP-binding cassette domain-containing protein [Rhodospirillales bacterium]
MATLTLRAVGFTAARPLFSNLSLVIGEADRIGLVAGNGAGKTTLLRCLHGTLAPSAGAITRSRGLRTALVAQDLPDRLLALTFAEAVHRALAPEVRGSEGWRADCVLDELAVPPVLRERPVAALSGGWQRIVLLARAMVQDPDLLLLDEPTNHLDLEAIERLETWLTGPARRLPLVVASHDRAFLDRCTNRTLFLHPDGCRLYTQPYGRARALLEADATAEATRQARDAKEAARLRRSAQELRNIGINSRSDAAQVKSAQLATRADRLEAGLERRSGVRPGEIRLVARESHVPHLVRLQDVTVTTPAGAPLIRIPRLDIARGDRVVLRGRNGVGKSLLLRLLLRAAQEDVPGIRIGGSVVVGWIDQHMAQLPPDATPFGVVAAQGRLPDQRVRALLAGAGIAVEQQPRPIDRLSPGQRARLGLLVLRLQAPNLYLLVEPTNHLDIPGQEALERELAAGGATCVLVSHDRRFVEAVGTRFLHIEGGMLREEDQG